MQYSPCCRANAWTIERTSSRGRCTVRHGVRDGGDQRRLSRYVLTSTDTFGGGVNQPMPNNFVTDLDV